MMSLSGVSDYLDTFYILFIAAAIVYVVNVIGATVVGQIYYYLNPIHNRTCVHKNISKRVDGASSNVR